MARIVFNANLSKYKKDIPSGIVLTIKGKRDIGVIDERKVTYENQHLFNAGILWDNHKHLLKMVDEEKNSNANIGVFISSYPTILVDGKVFISEYLELGKDIGSISYKRDLGGYNPDINPNENIEVITDGLVGVFPKTTRVYLTVGTAPKRLILKNSEGFYFVCDFEDGNWYTLRPGASELEIFDYNSTLKDKNILKELLPFPTLDRHLYDDEINKLINGEFDLKKHTFKYV